MPTPSRRPSHPIRTIHHAPALGLALGLGLALAAAAGCAWPAPASEGDKCTEARIRSVPAGSITIDADPGDWAAAGIAPLLQRAPGSPTPTNAVAGYRLNAFSVAADRDKLYLRIDAVFLSRLSEAGMPLDAGGGGGGGQTPQLHVSLKTTALRSGDLTFQPPGEGVCGDAGQRCCNGNGCSSGSVCDTGSGTCVKCGLGDPCCTGRSCAAGICAGPDSGTCAHCGATGELCCPGNTCSPGSVCAPTTGTCVHCGAAGEPCCALRACEGGGCCTSGGPCTGGLCEHCTPSGVVCPSPLGGTCQNGSCGGCGGRDRSCCASSTCTAAATSCSGGSCIGCGGMSQPCCMGPSGPTCGPSLNCGDKQVCTACGGAGQVCCQGPSGPPSCVSPLTCATNNNTCIASGGAQACCSGPSCFSGGSGGSGGWTCSAQWHTDNGSQQAIAGEVRGKVSDTGAVIEAWISAKDFGNLISLYPTSSHCCQQNGPPAVDDEIGCIWARWPP